MRMLDLREDWKFKDVKENVEALVVQFEDILSPFLCFQSEERLKVMRRIRKQVFEYENILYWQRERLWEVLNGYFEVEKFKSIQ